MEIFKMTSNIFRAAKALIGEVTADNLAFTFIALRYP
jgi:hypothetical protein